MATFATTTPTSVGAQFASNHTSPAGCKGTLPALSVTTRRWMGAELGGENPQPVFRGPDPDTRVRTLDGLAQETARDIGRGCGRRVLPYRLQDRYNRDLQPREFQAIVLDNGILKATFLPELGGRLISLFDRPGNRELLFDNPVFQPANLALLDAWFAGGIEWNIGQFGHAYHTCSPVFAAAIPGTHGGSGLRIYEYERLKGIFWQTDFHLPPASGFLHAFTRVVNPRDVDVDLYWWTNIAVAETPGIRVLAPAEESVFVSYDDPDGLLAYGQAKLPSLPTIGGGDGTYPENLGFTNEFFFQCQHSGMPWEAALDAQGRGLFEASTAPLNVRKVFAWGMHQGGRRWQEYLSKQGEGYLEIQAGLAPTQQHTVPLAARGQICWTQVFGPLQVDPELAHHADWTVARNGVMATLTEKLNRWDMEGIHRDCAGLAEVAPHEWIHHGSGWGALELTRRKIADLPGIPAALVFSPETMGPAQHPWLSLLLSNHFKEQDAAAPPGGWMIQSEWKHLLEDGLSNKSNHHWFTFLHLGVMHMEHGEANHAKSAWEESMKLRPTAWACRNLAVVALRQGHADHALERFRGAWNLACRDGTPDISFAIEYLTALHDTCRYDELWAFYQSLNESMREADPVRLLAAKAAFARGDTGFVRVVLDREFSTIREGARDLTDLWFGMEAERIAAERGCEPSAALLAEIKKSLRPPPHIDFRVVE